MHRDMIVSFETAKRLKEAGFPKPRPDEGQIWYNAAGIMYVITYSYGKTCDYVVRGSNNVWLERGLNDGEVFGPTATDIMQHLPGWSLMFTETGWICFPSKYWFGKPDFSSSNPAEAAAEAWFFEKSKQAVYLCPIINEQGKKYEQDFFRNIHNWSLA